NKITATKVFTYQNYQFENLSVQEVWTGQVLQENGHLTITFNIRQADLFSFAEGHSRTPEMFKADIKVVEEIDLRSSSIPKDFTRKEEHFSEKISGVNELGAAPLWSPLRTQSECYGKEGSTLIKLGKDLLALRVFDWFHDDPKVKSYENREEYKSKKQFIIFDPTDYQFYQNNPHLLRVVNKVPDAISLIEDIQRRNAYAPSLEDKMKYFENDMTKFHINQLGIVSYAQFDQNGNFIKYLLDGDAALWTGMYLGAEAMRYQLTREVQALDNVKKSLKGLMLLMDITEDPKNFGRSVMMDDGSIKANESFHQGRGVHQDRIWLSTGNNDMYKGLVHGFIWSYLVIPESDSEIRQQLLRHMALLPELNVAQSTGNKATAYGLKALATKSEDDKKEYIQNFKRDQLPAKLLNIEGSTHLGGIADWSGLNLGMVGTVSNVLLAKAIMKDFPSKHKWYKQNEEDNYQESMRSLVLQWKDIADTRRDFMTIAAHTFAVKAGFKLRDANEMNDGLNIDELEKKWDKSISNALWTLREIPLYRSKYDIQYDFSLRPDWSLSWWPRMPWKSITKRQSIEFHMQGAYAYPLFESLGLGSNMIWKDQLYGYQGGSNKTFKASGADYLYTYWMSKLGGLL
ncbi:MAG: hypothetical protein ACXVLQ_18625, partial [Bacteriovorax sp.]